jgi:hypothetical protein
VNTEHTWLGLVPPKGETPYGLGPDVKPGDAIALSSDESRMLSRLMATAHPLTEADNLRQHVCRTLGPQRVAVILQNYERGQSTPVTVEP